MSRLPAAGMLGLLLAGMLSACGFHLQRAPELPPSMRKIYVAAPGQSGQLLRVLRRSLASDQTEVLDTPEGATATLSIINVQRASRPVAVDSNSNPVEYQVSYTVEFSLIVQGATVLEPQAVTLNRNYAYSVANAVANEEQEQALEQAMARGVAQLISSRVAAAAKNLPPAATTAAVPAAATQAVPAPASIPAPRRRPGRLPRLLPCRPCNRPI